LRRSVCLWGEIYSVGAGGVCVLPGVAGARSSGRSAGASSLVVAFFWRFSSALRFFASSRWRFSYE
jgi:hypothetical protein